MKLNKLKSFIPIIAWLVVCSAMFVVWMMIYSSLDDKIAKIDQIKIQTKIAEEKLKQRRDLRETVIRLKNQKQKIDNIFLNKDSLINFIELLESMSKSAGVTLKKNSTSAEKNPVFDLSAGGSYGQVHNFLVSLENMPYKINIDNVTMKEKVGVASSTSWIADFRITLLSYEIQI